MAIAVDFETFYSKKLKYSVRTMIPEQYASHQLFDAYMVSVCDGESAWSGPVSQLNWNALDKEVWLSHNRRFDNTVHDELIRRKLVPDIRPSAWHCTADMTAFLCNRRSLDQAVEFLYHTKPDKTVRSDAEGKKWPTDFTIKEQEAMLKYAKHDAQWSHRLYTDFGDKWPAFERRLADLTTRQGMRGVKINRDLLEDYINTTHEMLRNTEKLIPWLKDAADDDDDDWEGFNVKPTATKCIAEQCRRVGIVAPPLKSKDAEDYEEWEKKFGPRYEWVYAVGAWRSINKLHKDFTKVKARLRSDDTLPFALKYFGAHCFTGDHEVLTRSGWVRLDEWAGGEIMQWDGECLGFDSAVANKFEVSTGERLLQLKTGHVDAIMTEGHWLSVFSTKTGIRSDVQAGSARHGRWDLPISSHYRGGGINQSPWAIKLLVAIQADGHYLTDCRSIRFRFSRPRKIVRLREILSESGLDWKERVNPSEPRVVEFVIRQFPKWLENRKTWTSELLTWTPNSLSIFCDELVHWDGSRSGPNSIEYVSTNKQNADWVATIAHLIGKAATMTRRNRLPEQPNWADAWRVSIRSATQTRIDKKHWKDAGEATAVFCPTAKKGACLFRHKDTIFITKQTGRWSGDSGVNMQNMRKVPAFMNERGLLEQNEKRIVDACAQNEEDGTWPSRVQKVIDFRALVIPRTGKKMIVSDLSQIEPRVLAWITGDTAFLDYVRAGNSPYEAHARASMGYTGGKMDKNTTLYKLAKARILGLGYQCGWEKFITMAYTLARLDITADDPEWIEEENPLTGVVEKRCGYGEGSRKAVADFRSQNPKIVNLWSTMDAAFKGSETDKINNYEVELPSGRVMTYRNVRSSVTIVRDPKTGKPRQKWIVTADIGGRKGRVQLYGGKLVENLIQATARDVFGFHVLRLEDNGWDNLFSVHDEAVLEVDQDVSAKDVEHTMSECPEWLKGCPLSAEAKEVDHYLK